MSIKHSRKNSALKFLLPILAIWALLYASFSLIRPALLDDADSLHAEVAREMYVSHDWVTLHANGIRYLEKAPLLYWSMASSFKIFGVSAWAARLPLALYSLALLLATFLLGRRLFCSVVPGFYGALILLTSFGIFIFTRTLIPDVLVCLWMTLAMLAFWNSLQQEEPSMRSALGFAATCALGVLSKGLIGVVFPLLVVLIFLLLTRNLGHLRRWHPLSSAAVFLLIAAPWQIIAGLRNPTQGHPIGMSPSPGNVRGFFWFYFFNEHVLRYLNLRIPRDYDTVPLVLFWALVLVWLMPWCAFLFKALGQVPLMRALRREPLDTPQKALLLLAIWASVVLVFFSFSTRQEYYSLPALPALAMLTAAWLALDENAPPRQAGKRIAVVLFVLGIVGAGVSIFLAMHGRVPPPGSDLATLIQQNPANYALSFGHFLDLNPTAMGAFRLPLLITAAALLVGTSLNLYCRFRNRVRSANWFLAGLSVCFLVATFLALNTFSPVLSSQILADAIRPELAPEDVVIINGEYESASTLGFYLERQVRILNGRSSDLWYGSMFSDAPPIFEDDASVAKLWGGPDRVFLWTRPDHIPQLPGEIYVVARSGGKEVISNESNSGGAEF
jgi:4-amino-4-deoxy-L-arabinose transferase-like glycosyltransferase